MQLNAANRAIEDYVLLPVPVQTGRYVRLSSDSLHRHRGALCDGKNALFGVINENLARSTRDASSRSGPPNKRKKPSRPKPEAPARGCDRAEVENRFDEGAVIRRKSAFSFALFESSQEVSSSAIGLAPLPARTSTLRTTVLPNGANNSSRYQNSPPAGTCGLG